MAILVADVGGTNSRLAVGREGRIEQDSIRKFKNADYESFANILIGYLRDYDIDAVDACSFAVAGPVSGNRGRLTNLDWEISEQDISSRFSSCNVVILNDLVALGYALNRLPADGLVPVENSSDRHPENGQSLVIGIGTGFNVCAVKKVGATRPAVMEAEVGHADLPGAVYRMLEQDLKADAARFASIEELFCGRGLSSYHHSFTGASMMQSGEILSASQSGDHQARQVINNYGRMLGVLARELKLTFLPADGIYFAGSVARGLFRAGITASFLPELNTLQRSAIQLGDFPVHVIDDDCAALYGCLSACGS